MNELTAFHHDIKNILEQARGKARSAVNSAMVEAYWLMGMKTKLFPPSFPRSCVGTHTKVKQERGMGSHAGAWEPEKGLDERELRRIRQFYLYFPKWCVFRRM